MQRDIKKYKVVRRGQQWCVRVKGVINTTDSWHWCRERNMSYQKIKQHWCVGRTWDKTTYSPIFWDYDFIFDKEKEALTFVLGYL